VKSEEKLEICHGCNGPCYFSSDSGIKEFLDSMYVDLAQPLNELINKIKKMHKRMGIEKYPSLEELDLRVQVPGIFLNCIQDAYFHATTCCYFLSANIMPSLEFKQSIRRIEDLIGIPNETLCVSTRWALRSLHHDLVRDAYHILEIFFTNIFEKIVKIDPKEKQKADKYREKIFYENYKLPRELKTLINSPVLEEKIMQHFKQYIGSNKGVNTYMGSMDSVLEWLYGKDASTTKKSPFRILSNIRNTYHNNGLHIRRKEEFKIKEQVYKFKQGKPIRCAGVWHVLCVIDEIVTEYESMIFNEKIKKIDYIGDESISIMAAASVYH